MNITKRIKSYFFRGLAVLLPTMLTIWLLLWGYNFIQANISAHINRGMVWLMSRAPFMPGWWTPEELRRFWVEGVGSVTGFLIAIIMVCVVGAMLANVVGRSLWHLVEKFILNTPILKRVYPYVKQITDFVFAKNKMSFSRVVAFEYPRKGAWSIGFLTGQGLRKVSESIEKQMVTVFVPTSPTPFTGYVIMVPKDEVIDMDMTIEEALRFTISGGVITPSTHIKGHKINILPETK